MKKLGKIFSAAVLTFVFAASAQAGPLVYPVGTVRYDPAKAWNSYIVLSSARTVKMVDRNGNLVKEWDIHQQGYAMPAKVLPGGYAMSNINGALPGGHQESNAVGIIDWNNNVVRTFNHMQKVDPDPAVPKDANGEYWSARQHHDFEIEGMPAGYYAPGQKVKMDGKMLVLAHENVKHPGIHPGVLVDDAIVVVDKDNKVIWKWLASDHVDEFGFTQAAKNVTTSIKLPRNLPKYEGVDWFHINTASWLGPNKWYDEDPVKYAAFHPDNIIADSRNSSHMFIIDHVTGKIVWQVAPPFVGEDGSLGMFAGIHNTHMIPKGLPGEGNILVFDNGGAVALNTYIDQNHDYSRVVEFNPVTKKKVWEYSPSACGIMIGIAPNFFFSNFISNAQRLPNGNTLICEGSSAHIIEVTPNHEIVWEYISPFNTMLAGKAHYNYRAYAVPYDFIPQLKHPTEVSVTPPAWGHMVLPNDKGELPDFQPKLDKDPSVNFMPLAPVASKK